MMRLMGNGNTCYHGGRGLLSTLEIMSKGK